VSACYLQETSAGAEKKKPSGSGKAATEGEPTRNRRVTGLILLFDGEADCSKAIVTSTTKPVSWLGAWPRSRLPNA